MIPTNILVKCVGGIGSGIGNLRPTKIWKWEFDIYFGIWNLDAKSSLEAAFKICGIWKLEHIVWNLEIRT